MSLMGGYIRNDITKNGKKHKLLFWRREPSEQKLVPIKKDGLLFLVFFIELSGLQKGHEQ